MTTMERRTTDHAAETAHPSPTLALPSNSVIGAELHRLVHSAIESIDGATLASFACAVDRDDCIQEVVVDTSVEVASVHAADVGDESGPGATARESGEVVRISSMADGGPWEPFRDACRALGIMSTASFPISVGGQRPAVLTVFSPDYHAFDVEAIRTGREIAGAMSETLEAAGPRWLPSSVS